MTVKPVIPEVDNNINRGGLNAREAAEVLRAVGQILLPAHAPGDEFPYEIGAFFDPGEGCITYKALRDGGMRLIFTRFDPKERILALEERATRLEAFCAILREGFPQLVNVVAAEILQDAAGSLGPITIRHSS